MNEEAKKSKKQHPINCTSCSLNKKRKQKNTLSYLFLFPIKNIVLPFIIIIKLYN